MLACVVRFWILPVLPLALPDAGRFHLHDLHHISERRPRWWTTPVSAFVGAITHVVLDAFTHSDGSVVQVGGPLQASLFQVGGRTVHVFHVLQYGGSVLLGGYTIWWFWRMGSERRFVPEGRDATRSDASLSPAAIAAFWAWIVVSCGVAVAYAHTRAGYHYAFNRPFYGSKSVVIISFCWVAFFGLTFACLAAHPFIRRSRSDLAASAGGSVAA